ncbi:MAG TPA: UDP-N-acetylglucosamine 2-epimerase [Candidatus Ozemobacteraceae bacterium]|nr:UDP-N-acetylglucosamine 2-epimerase [Candidatus Ozemobacteraceae bacterium]
MAEKRKICVITGSRAEYGLLSPVMRAIREHPALALQIIATGAHLSADHGNTFRAIEEDGFVIDERVDLKLAGDAGAERARATGRGVSGFAEAFSRLVPDLILILGDRYEILAAATAALLMRIPIAHIAGGDVTEGAFDDAIRHCLTKLSHLHFVTSESAAARVRQLGEEPDRIIVSGSTGLDVIRLSPLLERQEVERRLDFSLRERNLLITFHPVTLGNISDERQLDELLAALDMLGPDVGLVFTAPNADPGESAIRSKIGEYRATHANACLRESLGQLLYLSTMNCCDAVVGNSSSGIYEAPSLKKPTVNIGDRQAGRERAPSVIDCPPDRTAIAQAIQKSFHLDCTGVTSPYGDGHATERIIARLSSIPDFKSLLRKHFIDLPSVFHA